MRHYFCHYVVSFTFNSMLSFLFYYVNLLKGKLLVNLCVSTLIDWGRATRICVGNLTITSSDNCLSPGRRHAIIWTDAGILLIGLSKTDFNEIIHFHSRKFENVPWQQGSWGQHGAHLGPTWPRWAPCTLLSGSSGRWRPFCLGLHVLTF